MSENHVDERVKSWLDGDFDEKTKAEICALAPEKLRDAFYKTLSFGTGGMRGLMGPGTNRMNIYTVRGATQGLANYIKKTAPKPYRVAISYDCRHNSREFAYDAASVLAANGIEAIVAHDLRPTPFLSFMVRHKKCTAGIMITASHNPPAYNGYKVYWSDGAQVVVPHDHGIIGEVENISDLSKIPTEKTFTEMTAADDEAYLTAISPAKKCKDPLSIVYTNLHGTGATLMKEALFRWGFSDVTLVESQEKPDGDFPTVKSPNPENREAFALAEKLMIAEGGDIAIASDPDADRMATLIKHGDEIVHLNGNELAALLLDHLLQSRPLPKNGAVIASIVTTRLVKQLAEKNGLAYSDVLTGFKYIGEKIDTWEKNKEHTFFFGAEQSFGYLAHTFCRDKDGIATGCLLAEAAANAKAKGKTLIDRLNEIYEMHGKYLEAENNVVFGEGEKAAKAMAEFMENLRKNPPEKVADFPVLSSIDYKNGHEDLPPSDVFALHLAGDATLIIRPSGTEPKIKVYGFLQGENATPGLMEKILHALI